MNALIRNLLVITLALPVGAYAHEGSEPPVPEAAAAAPQAPLTVAILDFGADGADAEQAGGQISVTLGALLSMEDGFTLVERGDLSRALEELELNLSGLANTGQAVQIGQLVGAKIIVTGKAFPLGDKLFITAKLIGTETSLVDAVLVKGPPSKLDELVVQLAEKMAQRLRDNGRNLIAGRGGVVDPVPELRRKLAGRELPVVAVIVPERHIAHAPAAPAAPDPAVETELKLLLRRCGFTVLDTKHNDLADWARGMDERDPDHWPRSLAGADIVIAGEAFSEYAGRIGNLVSATARAELNVIDRETGRILIADRTTTRGVDLSETIAGRTALQKAGAELGLRLLEKLADTLPEKPEAPQE